MQRVSRSSWDAFSTWQMRRCSGIQRHPVFRCQKTRHGIQRVGQMENSWRLPRTGYTYEKQGVASFGRIFRFKVVQPLHSPADIPKKAVTDRLSGFLSPGNYDISPSRVDGKSMLHRAGISFLPAGDSIGQYSQVSPYAHRAASFLYRLPEKFRPDGPLMLVVTPNMYFEANVDAVGFRQGLTKPHDVMGSAVASSCRMFDIEIIFQPIKLG